MLGKNVTERYQQLRDVIRAYPLGFFVHPRFGWIEAAVEVLSAEETPGDGINCINYQLRVEESGLRDAPRPSAVSYAQTANTRASSLVDRATSDAPNFLTQVLAVQRAAQGFGQILGQVTNAAKLVDLQAALRNLQSTSGALDGAPYFLRVDAAVIFGTAIQGYTRALASGPPIVRRQVAHTTILPRLCASLYGGKLALTMADEIRGLNRLPPLLIPAGFELLLRDPDAARKSFSTL
jgi:hypothetical protein